MRKEQVDSMHKEQVDFEHQERSNQEIVEMQVQEMRMDRAHLDKASSQNEKMRWNLIIKEPDVKVHETPGDAQHLKKQKIMAA